MTLIEYEYCDFLTFSYFGNDMHSCMSYLLIIIDVIDGADNMRISLSKQVFENEVFFFFILEQHAYLLIECVYTLGTVNIHRWR